MRKMSLLYITVAVFLASSSYAEEQFGTEIKNEVLGAMYSECIENPTLTGLAKLGKTTEKAFCSCFSEQVKKEFDKTDLEQKLNTGNITIKAFMDEIGKIGGKAGEYCADKLLKF